MYTGEKKATLIHYIGDETSATDFPHRNSCHSGRQFVRTCPSYLSSCEVLVQNRKANVVYKQEVATMKCEPALVPVKTPRNLKQLRNLRFKSLKNSRISRDALFNIHEIAYDIPGFVWKVTTFPDLICICGLQEILEEVDRVITLDDRLQLLSYDTTFQLGDFYVSPLIVRHSLFQERPCIPVMFLFHERKLQETHQDMFRECIRRVPSLKTAKCPIVTDKEKAITNAIKEEMPRIKLLSCWNHIFRDIRTWCRKHGAPLIDIAVYIEDIQLLFHSQNEEEYEKRLQVRREVWDAAFEKYYMDEIHPSVCHSVGRWVLEKYDIYNPYSGVTNNQSEGFNRLAHKYTKLIYTVMELF